MSEQLNGKRVAFVMANEGVEQIELTEPVRAMLYGTTVATDATAQISSEDGW